MMPHLTDAPVRRAVKSRQHFGIQLLLDCDGPANSQELAEVLDTISSNPELIAELRYWMSTMHVAQLIGNSRISYAEKIRETLRQLKAD